MAKPNYSFEKRQRELAKKKKEEKALKKAAGGEGEEAANPNEAAMALLRARGDAPEAPANDAPAGSPAEGDAQPAG